MAGYDASAALDDLFAQPDDGDTSEVTETVTARTESILAGPAKSDSIEAVLRLAEGLPRLDDVREIEEGDRSELSALEQQQKEQTEEVIAAAVAAGNASLWVVAQGLERVAKGKWWRRTHSTLGAYVEDKIGRSPVYARQLRANAPLALATAERTGTVPHPSHVKETRKTEKQYGTDAAVTLYEVVRDVSAELGEKPTAASLSAVHVRLPAELPAVPEQQRAVIEETTRRTLGVDRSASIEAPVFEEKSNGGASIEAPGGEAAAAPSGDAGAPGAADGPAGGEGDDIEDAEIVPEYLATLKDALKQLRALDRALTKDVFAKAATEPAEGEGYAEVRQAILRRATAIRNKALHAPEGQPAGG
ncbi:hypothetical protein ACFWII_36770 [Streptomyces sp. NPDC127063]|uniref:hypothetical protein n=1 Tax=Streptomyces sp. NPDC127063 TaxID=3347123 RepID=UPI003646CD21